MLVPAWYLWVAEWDRHAHLRNRCRREVHLSSRTKGGSVCVCVLGGLMEPVLPLPHWEMAGGMTGTPAWLTPFPTPT